jgi:hypothetical protein
MHPEDLGAADDLKSAPKAETDQSTYQTAAVIRTPKPCTLTHSQDHLDCVR